MNPDPDDVTRELNSIGLNRIDAKDEPDSVNDDEEEFTFTRVGDATTVFPLFDQSLLYGKGKRMNDVHVDNVFVESTSSSSTTTLTAVTDPNGMSTKSNSTGFSRLWRFRDDNDMGRSNSDGRDAFVFFLNPKTEVNKKQKKKPNVSAHEVYMKKAKGEEEKRKSYRPGLMGFFTNVNGGLTKNVHPF